MELIELRLRDGIELFDISPLSDPKVCDRIARFFSTTYAELLTI
jgi:hypothetical protein